MALFVLSLPLLQRKYQSHGARSGEGRGHLTENTEPSVTQNIQSPLTISFSGEGMNGESQNHPSSGNFLQTKPRATQYNIWNFKKKKSIKPKRQRKKPRALSPYTTCLGSSKGGNASQCWLLPLESSASPLENSPAPLDNAVLPLSMHAISVS